MDNIFVYKNIYIFLQSQLKAYTSWNHTHTVSFTKRFVTYYIAFSLTTSTEITSKHDFMLVVRHDFLVSHV